MKMILKGRGEGKTTELVKLSAETGYPIVTHSVGHNEVIKTRAKELKINIPKPIHFKQLDSLRGMHISGVLVDDADMLLSSLIYQACRARIGAIAMSVDDLSLSN